MLQCELDTFSDSVGVKWEEPAVSGTLVIDIFDSLVSVFNYFNPFQLWMTQLPFCLHMSVSEWPAELHFSEMLRIQEGDKQPMVYFNCPWRLCVCGDCHWPNAAQMPSGNWNRHGGSGYFQLWQWQLMTATPPQIRAPYLAWIHSQFPAN